MPKLNSEMQDRVNAAQADPFAPLPRGFHVLKLKEVKSGKSTNTGRPMWTWIYVSQEPVKGKTVRDYSVFDAEWKFKQIFNAFGVGADVDTDDLIGKTIIAEIDHQPSQKNENRMVHYIAGYPDQDVTKPTLFDEPEDEPEPAPKKSSPRAKKDDGQVPF